MSRALAAACRKCGKDIAGTVADPVIATSKGVFHFECMRAKHGHRVPADQQAARIYRVEDVARADASVCRVCGAQGATGGACDACVAEFGAPRVGATGQATLFNGGDDDE